MSELLEENHPQISQISADSESNLRESAKSADRSFFRRAIWMSVEVVLVVVILGLITATVLPVFVGRSKNADRFDFLRRPAQQQSRVPRTSR